MQDLDSDGDGKLTPNDAAWSSLRLWVDKNRDGISEPGELYTMSQAGIEYINLNAISMMEVDPEGNQTRLRSTYHRSYSGQDVALLLVDIWFNTLVSH